MKRIICSDIKVMFRSKRFWTAVGFIVFTVLINLIEKVAGCHAEKPEGVFGLFIYGNIMSNPMMNFFAPFIPAFVFGPLIVGDISFSDHKGQRINIKRHLAAKSISSLILGASVFLFSFLVILIGCFIFDPTIAEIEYAPIGLFQEVYFSSVPLYILLFMLYSSLFGALYSFFSMGIGLITKSFSMAMVLPGIIYHCTSFTWFLFDNPLLSWTTWLIPGFTYPFDLGVSAIDRTTRLSAVFLASIILVVAGYFKLKRQAAAEKIAEAKSGDYSA